MLQIDPYCGVNHNPYYGLFVSIQSPRYARPLLKKAGANNAVNLSNHKTALAVFTGNS